ncbi:MAG: tetratricopeptide repeat protein, partial [Chloroflexota bacterium]
MQPEYKTVFISYRRDAAAFIARSIFLDLRDNGYDVFMDVESIDAGDFEQVIFNQLEARAHFLVILAPGTVERYAEPNDMMRREIEFAIDHQRNIVPLLMPNFSFEDAKPYLTGKLAQLPNFNGVSISHDYFDAAMERLRTRFLSKFTTGEIKPVSASEQAVVQAKIDIFAAQPAPTPNQLNAEAVFARAYSEQLAGNIEVAFNSYNEALRINPQFAMAYNNRGWIQFMRGSLAAAIADYNESIRLNPMTPLPYINRGMAYYNKRQWDAASSDFTSAITIYPQSFGAYFGRGNVFMAQGNAAAALYDYNMALSLNPQYAEAYCNRGWVYYNVGNFNGALYDYNMAINLNAQYAP